MVKQVKQAKADIYLRDTDSQSLFNNSGELSFKYYHEWNDCYNPTTGKTTQIDGEVYDEETNSYKPNCPEGYIPVFNGRQSALWDNMVSCFPDKIQDMYKAMRNNGLSYSDMFAKYKDYWKLWCENLYNADAFGYANTGNFEKAFGDKLQMMNFFFYKRQRYLDSKYCCGSSVSNTLRLRLSETGKGLALKYYQALYSSLQWGIGSFATQRNIEPGTYSYQPWGIKNPQDATFDIDDADLITELSTYTKTSSGYTITGLEGVGNFKFDSDMGILKRLTKFIMNYTVAKPNTNELGAYFDLSGMTLLKQVIVRNVKNLTKSIVINSDMVEEIDFTNTPIVGITTPPSDSLTKLVLPNTITSLKLKGYTNLSANGLQIAGYSNINEFEIEDCPNIDALALLTECYNAGAPLSEVTLNGIDWTLDSMDLLMYLAEKKAKLKGQITISDTVIVSLTQKLQLMAAFGDIDDKDNSLYISYSMYEIKKVSITGKGYLMEKGNYTFEAKTSPSNGNNAKNFTWSISENSFATISQSGVLTLNKVGSKENDDKATITLSVTLSDGSTLEASKEVLFYKKDCQLGDYVFSDGSWGSELSDNPQRSVVGVVFYLEPVKRRYALAVSLKSIRDKSNYANLYSWGLSPSSFTNLSFNEYKKDAFNIQTIPNIDRLQAAGLRMNVSDYLDSDAVDNDGFKVYESTKPLGDIGFREITSSIYNELEDFLEEVGLGIGDYISVGQLYTFRIMNHRNQILSDSAVNLPIPYKTETNTEMEILDKYIQDVVSKNSQDKYAQYYYPDASYGYCYLPTLKKDEDLDESVGLHRWFLPSVGEWSRMLLYYRWNNNESYPKLHVFNKAYEENVLSKFGDADNNNNRYASSSESNYSSNNSIWHINPLIDAPNGMLSAGEYYYKNSTFIVRPIVSIKI